MRKAPRILLVMDSSGTIQSIQKKLMQGGLNPKWNQVRTKDELGDELRHQDWDLVIVDYDMPELGGFKVLEYKIHHNLDLPFIFISNRSDDKLFMKAIQNGASDFISKENLVRLLPAINRELKYSKVIMQQKLSEKELRYSNNFLLNIFNGVQEGISVLNNNFIIIRVNSWLNNQFSSKLPIVGKKCYEVYQDRISPCPSCPFNGALKTGFIHQECIAMQDGSLTRWFEITAYPFKNTNGDIIGIIQSLKDITKRKKAEDKLLKLNKDLEQRVIQRTAQLEASNKELESFSYSVSHDLRSPLARIEGYSELLLSENFDMLDDDGRHYLDRIILSVNQMSQLIDDLLKLSLVTRSEMNFSLVNLSAIAKHIVDTLIESDPERKAEFIIHEDLQATGDGHLLRVVFENLLNNAWKFTQKKPAAKIEFGVKKDQPTPVFFIKDNGAGFNMSNVENLFTPFRRLHSDKDFPGTVVGLATVQRIIRRHGGKIWAEGKENSGATFYFTLTGNGKL